MNKSANLCKKFSKKTSSLAKSGLLRLIKLYQSTLSLDHGWFSGSHPGGFCRYQPTCSDYGYIAIERFGAARGSLMAFKRVCRCHPFARGGYDPVPPAISEVLSDQPRQAN